MHKFDNVISHPSHYISGGEIEPIDYIDSHEFNFNRGNVIKYVTRAGLKGDSVNKEIEDLEKAIWYLNREIQRLKDINGIN